MVECASYNQKLLALRARRLAQQRMDYFHRVAATEREEAEQERDGTKEPISLGPAPQLTADSDDEDYELTEIHAPVPYQKGYWLAAKNAQQKRQRQQQQQQMNSANRNTANTRSQAHHQSQQRPVTNVQHQQRQTMISSAASSNSSSSSNGSRGSKPIKRTPYKYQYNPSPATTQQTGYRKTGPAQQSLYQQQQKQPQYKPASQHHPSYAKKRKDGPPALV